MNIRMLVKGAAETARRFLGIWKRAHDLSPIAAQLEDAMRGFHRERFDSAWEGRWPPLAARTRENKAATGMSPEILRATDRLMNSLTGHSAEGFFRTKGTRFEFGTTVPYASFLYGRRDMPGRPPVGIYGTQFDRLREMITAHIVGSDA